MPRSSSPKQQAECVPVSKRSTSTGARPTTAHRSSSASALLESSPLYKPLISARQWPSRHVHVPLEVDAPRGSKLDRSSFRLLEKSVGIVTEATGRSLKKFDLFGNDEDDATCSDDLKTVGPQRVESWPTPSRPKSHVLFQQMETARLIRASPHSIAQPNMLRPSTTALERRRPQLSTIASERGKAQEIGKRLLGPITLESKQQNHAMAIPNSLHLDEWENELARNIINVFSNKVRSDIKQSDELVDYIPPATSTSKTEAIGGFFKNDHDSDYGRDFQRISISRGLSFSLDENDHNDTIILDAPKQAPSLRTSQVAMKGRKGRQSSGSGTFRLKMIWMTGTGMVRPNWQLLHDLESDFNIDCDELITLEEKGSYMKYIRLVEMAIVQWSRNTSREDHSALKRRMWQQLVVTSNGFATKAIEKKKYAKAMELLDRQQSILIDNELGLLPEMTRNELTAMTKDTYAYYYIRRSKPSASLQYVISAINIYKKSSDPSRFFNVAKCRLHEAYIHCTHNKYDKSMSSLGKILAMIESGSLDVQFNNKQHILLLISITYHNIAVQQLMTGHCSDACVSSQNARRLARLCLSVSSHYLPVLESTHKQSLNQLSLVLKNSHTQEDQQQASLFHGLISELFE